MVKKGKIVKIGLHTLGWGCFVFLNILLIKSAGAKFDINRQLILLAVYLVVFYGFYFLIAPLLLKKKILLFVITSVVFISGAVISNQTIQRRYHEKVMQEVIEEKKKQGVFPEGMEREMRRQVERRPSFARSNFRLINSVFQVLFFVLVSVLLRFVQKWQQDEETRYVLEKEKSDAELLFLKQQINPHFLFNSLNSIYSLANKKSDLTTEAILKLSGILRYVLYHSEKNLVPLNEEVTTIENYIELQRLRITKKVKLNFDKKGNPETYLIEPLLLMPIFENAFKHGIDSITETFINIHLEIKGGKLYLNTANKIIPQKEKSDEESGIGLKNIRRRLELLYPDNYKLNISELKQIFNLKLELTLKK